MVYRHYLSEYRKTPNGVILVPVQIRRWLVVFRDETNFPTQDKYGTQRILLASACRMRSDWRASDKAWVKLDHSNSIISSHIKK
jgi:hypothetical protein